MATPQQLMAKAKSQLQGGSQPNTGGSRGAPARGGVAARPAVGGGLQGRPARPSGAVSSTGAGPGGAPGAAPPRPGAEPALTGRQMGINLSRDAANSAALARTPDAARGALGIQPAAKPAWQQLQEAGIGGQGSAAANKAKLALLGGGPEGSGGIVAPDQMPGGAPDMPVGSPAGPPTINTFPGFKPRPGAEPALAGMMGGPRPQGRMPVDNIMDLDGPAPAGPSGGGGSAFGDIAATAAPFAAGMNRPGGADLANRFRPPVSLPTYNPLR